MAELFRTRWVPITFEEKSEEMRKKAMVWSEHYDDDWYLREIKNSKFTYHHIPERRRTDEMLDLHKFYWII